MKRKRAEVYDGLPNAEGKQTIWYAVAINPSISHNLKELIGTGKVSIKLR